MKNTHICPKCGGGDIVRCQAKGLGKYDEIPIGLFGSAQMSRYVCCTCGYCELWTERGQLEELKKAWETRAGKTEENP